MHAGACLTTTAVLPATERRNPRCLKIVRKLRPEMGPPLPRVSISRQGVTFTNCSVVPAPITDPVESPPLATYAVLFVVFIAMA